MFTVKEVITPELARAYLARNIAGNRPLIKPRVQYLARAIQRGEWKVTHQGIAFDAEGNLTDGQHRLAAVIEADLAVDCLVTRGLGKDAFLAMDQGKPRAAADLFNVDKKIVNVVNTIWRLVNNREKRPTPRQIEPFIRYFAPLAEPFTIVRAARGVGKMAVKAGAVLQFARGHQNIPDVYHALVNMRFEELTPLQQKFARRLLTHPMGTDETAIRAYMAFDPNTSAKVSHHGHIDGAVKEIREFVQEYVTGAERSQSLAAE